MPTVTLDFSEGFFSALRRSPGEFADELRRAAAIYWYARGMISQEKAAEIADLDRTDFLLTLSWEEVDAFAVEVEALQQELARG